MQPKAYVPGVALLLTSLLGGCTGSDEAGTPDDRPDGTSTTATTAQPGRYRTLPEPCGAIPIESLNSLLPGIKQLTEKEQRETAYEGVPRQTFDTDRRVGCQWKVESTDATNHLFVEFERVVSYDNAVSDDRKAEELYSAKELDADLPGPSATATDGGAPDADDDGGADGGGEGSDDQEGDATPSETPSAPASAPSGSPSSGTAATPAALQPRTLDGLGDAGFLNDEPSTAQQRTVTVVFRTSNVIVTVEYVEQSASVKELPNSEEMQDRALNLAGRLAESFEE